MPPPAADVRTRWKTEGIDPFSLADFDRGRSMHALITISAQAWGTMRVDDID